MPKSYPGEEKDEDERKSGATKQSKNDLEATIMMMLKKHMAGGDKSKKGPCKIHSTNGHDKNNKKKFSTIGNYKKKTGRNSQGHKRKTEGAKKCESLFHGVEGPMASTVLTQFHVNKGLKVFGEKGVGAIRKELQQIHYVKVSCVSFFGFFSF